MVQNADGTPHFAYYDKPLLLSFVWDGDPEHKIEVSHGGYGEPVVDRIELPTLITESELGSPIEWLRWFKGACDGYVAAMGRKWRTLR